MRLATVLEAAGVTREEMRALVLQRREEQRQAEQHRVDAELLRIGREFAEEQLERRESRALTFAVEKPAKPPLIETDGCSAYRCPNVAEIEVIVAINGRLLRALYCKPHGTERRAESAADGGLNGRST